MVYIIYAHEPEITGLVKLISEFGLTCTYVRAHGNTAGETLSAALGDAPTGNGSVSSPSLILNIGFAGALNPALHLGDLVIVDRFTSIDISRAQLPPVSLPPLIDTYCNEQGYAKVGCITVRDQIAAEADKRDCRQASGADIVDMEGLHLSESAGLSKTPFASLKVISDEADRSAYASAVGQAGRWSKILVRATCSLLCQIKEAKDGTRGA